MKKIVCIGECLVDMIPENGNYVPHIGGAPFNVSAHCAKLGANAYYLGKLGGDEYASFLLDKINSSGVKTDYIAVDDSLKTALAFVTLDNKGDRSFTFLRDNTADMNLSESDIDESMLANGDILHFCSVGLVAKSELAHKKAIELAMEKGALISFDVNIRPMLWNSLKECIDKIREFLPFADIVKVTEEELLQITGVYDEISAVKVLFECAKRCELAIVTKGENGASAYTRELLACDSMARKITVKNSTGAGDCFIACVLYKIANTGLPKDTCKIKEFLDFANERTAKFLVGDI